VNHTITVCVLVCVCVPDVEVNHLLKECIVVTPILSMKDNERTRGLTHCDLSQKLSNASNVHKKWIFSKSDITCFGWPSSSGIVHLCMQYC
jgi:hypothetical protein